jgi:hypothetical protein
MRWSAQETRSGTHKHCDLAQLPAGSEACIHHGHQYSTDSILPGLHVQQHATGDASWLPTYDDASCRAWLGTGQHMCRPETLRWTDSYCSIQVAASSEERYQEPMPSCPSKQAMGGYLCAGAVSVQPSTAQMHSCSGNLVLYGLLLT